jgi:hypothetical protein
VLVASPSQHTLDVALMGDSELDEVGVRARDEKSSITFYEVVVARLQDP